MKLKSIRPISRVYGHLSYIGTGPTAKLLSVGGCTGVWGGGGTLHWSFTKLDVNEFWSSVKENWKANH